MRTVSAEPVPLRPGVACLVGSAAVLAVLVLSGCGGGGPSCTDQQQEIGCATCSNETTCDTCSFNHTLRMSGKTQECFFPCLAPQTFFGCVDCTDQSTCTSCGPTLELLDIDGGKSCHFPCTASQKQSDNQCTRCGDAKTCHSCAAGYGLEEPPLNPKYTGDKAACQWQCTAAQKERSCARCDSESLCTKCADGYALEQGGAGTTTCQFQCTDEQKAGGCTRCNSAKHCVTCKNEAYKVIGDGHSHGTCIFQCTVPGTLNVIEGRKYSWLSHQGKVEGDVPQGACNPGKCLPPDSTHCAHGGCREGYRSEDNFCVPERDTDVLDFYLYRAVSDEDYDFNGINMASAGGVLSYLTVEVVASDHIGPKCKRKYDIYKILRFHVKVKNTPMAWNPFSEFVAFDKAQCTQGAPSFTMCNEIWRRKGYTVGCNNRPQGKYPNSHWYSMPGTCPQQNFEHKDDEDCAKYAPGGRCPNGKEPDGTPFCTYSMEAAGEVTLDELVGICKGKGCRDYSGWCHRGGIEFHCPGPIAKCPVDDLGVDFWKGWEDEGASAGRVEALENLFQKNFPWMPRKDTPSCRGFR